MHLVRSMPTLISSHVKLLRALVLLLTLACPSPNSSSSAVLTPFSAPHFPDIVILLITCWLESHLWPLSVSLLLHLLCCQILCVVLSSFLSLCLSWHVYYQHPWSGHLYPMSGTGILFDIVHYLDTRDILIWEPLVKDRVKDMGRSMEVWGVSQGWVAD